MSYEDLPCIDFVELATEYLEGALPLEQRLVVERHLAFCSPCVDYLEQMRAAIRATGRLREEDVPEPVMESLMEAFRAISRRAPGD
jgi:anti-sigma factor RsiW